MSRYTATPAMIRPGMTGTHEGKKFTVIRHAETGEVLDDGEVLNNQLMNKFWVEWEGHGKTLFCAPPLMTEKDWMFDQNP